MTDRRSLAGNILTAAGWVHGQLAFGERVLQLEGRPVDPAGNADVYVVPGFVDLHVHGGGGADIMEGASAALTVARLHARHGTTALLATTMTAPFAELEGVVEALGHAAENKKAG